MPDYKKKICLSSDLDQGPSSPNEIMVWNERATHILSVGFLPFDHKNLFFFSFKNMDLISDKLSEVNTLKKYPFLKFVKEIGFQFI